MNYIITGSGYVSELSKAESTNTKVITEQEFKTSEITLNKYDKVYSPTESALEIILERSQDTTFKNAVVALKDKSEFRELMSNLYPDFFYQKIDLIDLETAELDRTKSYIIKPNKGFFGTAVKTLKPKTDLTATVSDMKAELETNKKYFSDSILSADEMIIEQLAVGEEYAVDMYFDDIGEPVILNIYHHPVPEKQEYFHVLYYTNRKLFHKFYDALVNIFKDLNTHLKVRNFPIHAEFIEEDSVLVPIEMNPLRYGGFGLADLTLYAFGINPFQAFFENFKPDWVQIHNKNQDRNFGWVLGYNGTNIDVNSKIPNHVKYKNYLGNVLHYVETDYQNLPVFSVSYVEDDSAGSLKRLLKTEFNEFFTEKTN
jgi:hypothetical protein